MAQRKVFHVTYNYDEDRWFVWDVTGRKSKVLRRSHTKAMALKYATTQARSRRHIGQVVVHGMDGKIQNEWTYGADPVRTSG